MASNPPDDDRMKPELIESAGPWPFVTLRRFRRADGTQSVWRSRHHRKRLHWPEPGKVHATGALLARCVWMPRQLNWWIGVVFALGSTFFAVGSILSLAPSLAAKWSFEGNEINAIFFAGSIPFTIAAYLQLYQAANAGEFSTGGPSICRKRVALFGWDPANAGWLSCALQFVGTVLFNVDTFDAMVPGMNWFQQDLAIWIPNFVGSILFLASGYLAFIETCHAHWGWQPGSLSWWVVFVNLLGCVGFMISALFAFVLPREPEFNAAMISVGFTLMGAIGFFVGSVLMLPEAAMAEDS